MVEYRVEFGSVTPGLANTNFRLHLPLDVVDRNLRWCHGVPVGKILWFNETFSYFETFKIG